jgi:hypothetical protein
MNEQWSIDIVRMADGIMNEIDKINVCSIGEYIELLRYNNDGKRSKHDNNQV